MLETTIGRAAGGNAWRRLGKIKLGIKDKNAAGAEFPRDVDYFVIPDKYKAALGEKPQELSIVLANPELRQNFDSRAVMYLGNGSKACHTDDDRTAHRYMKPQGEAAYRWVTMACPNLQCEFRLNKKCKERGYFSFMIPAAGTVDKDGALKAEVGVFLMIMGSKVAITQIYTALKMVESLCHGRPNGMAGIRLKLRRERKEFFQDLKGDGQQAKIVKYIPHVDIDFAQLLHDDQVRLGPMFGQPILLPATPVPHALPEDEDAADDEEGGVA